MTADGDTSKKSSAIGRSTIVTVRSPPMYRSVSVHIIASTSASPVKPSLTSTSYKLCSNIGLSSLSALTYSLYCKARQSSSTMALLHMDTKMVVKHQGMTVHIGKRLGSSTSSSEAETITLRSLSKEKSGSSVKL